MTEYANPSNNFRPLSEPMSRCFKFAGHSDGFVVENDVIVSDVDSVGLTAGPLDGFRKTGESNLDVQIGSGEGLIDGTVVGKDMSTMVTLPANSTVTVVLAYVPSSESSLLIDTDANVTSSAGDVPRIDLYDFVTDADSITSQTDLRVVGEQIDVKNARYESSDGTGTVAVDNATALDGVDSTQYARVDQNESIMGTWEFNDTITVDSPQNNPAIQINGANATDSDELVIDGDEDTGQDDDLIKVRSVNDPRNNTATNDDTKFVVKGEGLVGVNKYNPATTLDVDGDLTIRGQSNFTDNVTVNGSLEATNTLTGQRVVVVEDGDGIIMAVAEPDRFFIAPVVNNNPRFGSEISYQIGDDTWNVESELEVNDNPVVSSSDGSYVIQKNGSDANGILNFKTQ